MCIEKEFLAEESGLNDDVFADCCIYDDDFKLKSVCNKIDKRVYYIDLDTYEIKLNDYSFVTDLGLLVDELNSMYKYWSEDENSLLDILDEVKKKYIK